MKNLSTLILLFWIIGLNAQCVPSSDPSYVPGPTITFTDANLLAALLAADTSNNIAGSPRKIDIDNSGTIEQCELTNLNRGIPIVLNRQELNGLGIGPISSLEGLEDSEIANLSLVGMQDFTNNELNFLHLPETLFQLEAIDCNLSDLLNMQNRPITQQSYVFRIEDNPNLTSINLTGYPITNLQFQSRFSNNGLTSIIFNPIPSGADPLLNAFDVFVAGNNLTTNAITSALSGLEPFVSQIIFSDNNLTGTLDLNAYIGLGTADINNNNLQQVFVKNGRIEGSPQLGLNNSPGLANNPSLQYVCADQAQVNDIQNHVGSGVTVNTYCTFAAGGAVSDVNVMYNYDLGNNNCTSGSTPVPNTFYNVNDGTTTYQTSTTAFTSPLILPNGNFTITPTNPFANNFNVSPGSVNIMFPGSPSPTNINFCLQNTTTNPDLEFDIVPITTAFINRPGLHSRYRVIVRNVGTEIHSGSFNFIYDDNFMDFVSATGSITPSNPTGMITWNFSNLSPFQSIQEDITLNLNRPTHATHPLNQGDILTFNANIDDTSSNNTDVSNTLRQTIVNSYDPNDKNCLQGDSVGPEVAGEFVDYIIRFENLGNANAINVVVRDIINQSQFDISTLTPISSSHPMRTDITNGNEVEFIFENINLAPSPSAPAQPILGFVHFKIKTLSTLTAGDSFSNQADIFFDFNPEITTNNFQTDIEVLNSVETELNKSSIKIFPNPAKDFVEIKSEDTIKKVQVFDSKGRLVQTVLNPSNRIDVNRLTKGIYLLQIETNNEQITKKLIKE